MPTTQMVIRNLDSLVIQKLKQQAKRNGRSVAAEVRYIIEQAVRFTPLDNPPLLGSRSVVPREVSPQSLVPPQPKPQSFSPPPSPQSDPVTEPTDAAPLEPRSFESKWTNEQNEKKQAKKERDKEKARASYIPLPTATDAGVKKLQKIYKEEYGVEASFEETRETLEGFMRFMYLTEVEPALRPIKEEIEKERNEPGSSRPAPPKSPQ